ncbi:MAG: DivIVA domain-containing protein [Vulcanibacillus sp.]
MLTPEEIFEKEFKRSVRGYDMDEVNEFLDQIIQDYARLMEENKVITRELQQFKSTSNRKSLHTSQEDKYTVEDLLRRVESLEKQIYRP